MSVYGADTPQLLGHLDVWNSEGDWSSLTIYPPRSDNNGQEKQLLLSGTPNLAFKVQIESSPKEVRLNEPKTFRLYPKNPNTDPVEVFQFTPGKDISDTQLDITVTSESDVPAYLKVSRDCKDVKDNIDVVDYKGESLRLSFAKKGRITLSKVSIPPLTDSTSSWFIGIAIKNATGDTPLDATKVGTLALAKSFDYSYFGPLIGLIVLSIAFGVLLSCWAIYCFPTPSKATDSQSNQGDKSSSTSTQQSSPSATHQSPPSGTHQPSASATHQSSPSATHQSSPSGTHQPSSSGTHQPSSTGTHQSPPSGTHKSSSSDNTGLHVQMTQVHQSQSRSTGGNQLQDYGSLGEQSPRYAPGKNRVDGDGSFTVPINTQEEERTPLRQRPEASDQQRNQTGDSDTHQKEIRIEGGSECCKIKCCEVLPNWFKRGPKTYSYITGIVGFVLMIGAGQFVFANWHLMIQEGDRDTCYYNDFCYRVSIYDDIPLNLMISNLTYMLHGLILAFFVWHMEAKLFAQHKDSNDLPPKHAFSIGYAFSWALIFEGCFSLVYHLCPSRLTFQFDTGFMFVIAGLVVILLYNGIEMKDNDRPTPIDAANVFLYFLVPLYIFNYFGTLSHSETGLVNRPALYFFVALWWVVISIWTGWKLFPDGRCSRTCIKDICKCTCFALGVIGVPVICFVIWGSDLPLVFLFACIAESIIAIVGTICYTITCITIKCDKKLVMKILQGFYIVVMIVLWGVAVNFFLALPTTDKALTPEKSRDLNKDCNVWKFFDDHDIWHVLSSHALLMTAYFVMYISQK